MKILIQVLIFISITVLIIITTRILYYLFHTPRHNLTKEQQDNILKNGVIHFTNKNTIFKIINSDTLLSISKHKKTRISRLLFYEPKNSVWLYMCTDNVTEKIKEIQSNPITSVKADIAIHLYNLEQEDTNKMLRRRYDGALIYKGKIEILQFCDKTNDITYTSSNIDSHIIADIYDCHGIKNSKVK